MIWPDNPLSMLIQIEEEALEQVMLYSLRRPRSPLFVRTVANARIDSRPVRLYQLETEWDGPRELEEWVVSLAWGMGAAKVWRRSHGPLEPDVDVMESLALGALVGAATVNAALNLCTDWDDLEPWVAEAARMGCWIWRFRPWFVQQEDPLFKRWRELDPSLNEDGSRADVPTWSAQPFRLSSDVGAYRQITYRLTPDAGSDGA